MNLCANFRREILNTCMKTNTATLIVNEGKTFIYLIPIIFCSIASLISFVFFWPLGIVLAVISIILSLAETGLELDQQTMKYRSFKSLLGYMWGTWKKIPQPESFHLRLSVESESYRDYTFGASTNYYGGSTATSKSITYDVLVQTQSEKWITLYEFLSYKKALVVIRALEEMKTFEVTDHIALKLQENQARRARRSI